MTITAHENHTHLPLDWTDHNGVYAATLFDFADIPGMDSGKLQALAYRIDSGGYNLAARYTTYLGKVYEIPLTEVNDLSTLMLFDGAAILAAVKYRADSLKALEALIGAWVEASK